MKKIILGLAILVCAILAFTNPNEEHHKYQIVKEYNYAKESNNVVLDTTATTLESTAKRLGENFGNILVERGLKNNTYSKNCLLFSLTYYRGKYCGFGVLNSVYLSNEFTELLNSIQ